MAVSGAKPEYYGLFNAVMRWIPLTMPAHRALRIYFAERDSMSFLAFAGAAPRNLYADLHGQ
ncbi:hypothetical protein E4U43_005200 [Claviceps pusilla]|uniref:Uncharacterized protein n=1 Tax=Claviceps pusilla TaxID=123648 RepID=A0A9P7NFI9_9HYPO|nr:hypothetical protein E4U43_005200 [Claviceps pusilla]